MTKKFNTYQQKYLVRIGGYLRKHRFKKHNKSISISKLASMTNLSKGYLYRLEKGQENPSLLNLIVISKALCIKKFKHVLVCLDSKYLNNIEFSHLLKEKKYKKNTNDD